MTESIETGLLLMIVGMSTVFVVLGIVVYTGRFLIVIANRFHVDTLPPTLAVQAEQSSDPSGAKIAAITGAIHTVTGGKGQITNIERLD